MVIEVTRGILGIQFEFDPTRPTHQPSEDTMSNARRETVGLVQATLEEGASGV